MKDHVNSAEANLNSELPFELMIFGLLTKEILPDATLLGFSRSGDFKNRELLDSQSYIFSIVDLTEEDIREMIEVIEDPKQREAILKQIKKIDRNLKNQILFVTQMMKLNGDQLGEITTDTELFLSILRGNLASQNEKRDAGFIELLNEETHQSNLKKIFRLCKEHFQDEGTSEGPEGVIYGHKVNEAKWKSKSSIEIDLNFLNIVGIFEISQSHFDKLTLTALHLSFIEFFGAVGILLSSDIKTEIEKIGNEDRYSAISVYIR